MTTYSPGARALTPAPGRRVVPSRPGPRGLHDSEHPAQVAGRPGSATLPAWARRRHGCRAPSVSAALPYMRHLRAPRDERSSRSPMRSRRTSIGHRTRAPQTEPTPTRRPRCVGDLWIGQPRRRFSLDRRDRQPEQDQREPQQVRERDSNDASRARRSQHPSALVDLIACHRTSSHVSARRAQRVSARFDEPHANSSNGSGSSRSSRSFKNRRDPCRSCALITFSW